MRLYEVMILAFFAPACWFGWKWFFRLLAAAAAGRMVAAAKDRAINKIMGKGEGKCTSANTAAGTSTSTAAQ